MQPISELKAWCSEGRRLLSMSDKKSAEKMELRSNDIADNLSILKYNPTYAKEYSDFLNRYQQLATAASGLADDDASAHLSAESRSAAIADVARNLSILKNQIRRVMVGPANDKKPKSKVEQKLNDAATHYGKRAKAIPPTMPAGERGAVLKQIAGDLNVLAKEAIDQGLPVVAARLAKQAQSILAHPSSYPPADDMRLAGPQDKAQSDKREKDRKALLAARRELLAENVERLRDAVKALTTAGSPAVGDAQMALQQAEEDLKFARVDTKDSYRAALTQGEMRTAMLKVDMKITELGLDSTGDDSLMESIATKLDHIVDEMVSEAVLNFMEKRKATASKDDPDSGKSYSAEMMKLIQDGNGKKLFAEFPGLKAMIDAEIANFTRNVTEVLETAHNDKKDVADTFFGGKKMKGLKKFTVADSDPHNGGRRVTILEFEAEDRTTHKIVNKPRDVRVDAKFVGNSKDLTQAEKDRLLHQKRSRERVKRIRALLPRSDTDLIQMTDDQLAAMTDEQIAARVSLEASRPRILGMTAKVNQDLPQLNPEDHQSLAEMATFCIQRSMKKRALQKARQAKRVEKIRAELKQKSNQELDAMSDDELAAMSDKDLADKIGGDGAGRMLALTRDVEAAVQDVADPNVKPMPSYKYLPKQSPGADGHPYGWVEYVDHGSTDDCVLTEAEAKEFYRQTGRQTALAMLFGIEDLHQGNLMVSKKQPQLTDLEISFSSKVFDQFTKQHQAFVQKGRPPTFEPGYQTMMHQALVDVSQVEHHGNAAVCGDRITSAKETTEEPLDNHLAVTGDDGELTTIGDGLADTFGPDIQEGFKEILDALADPDMKDQLDAFVASFQGTHVRYHAIATKDQLAARRDQMASGYADPEQSGIDKKFEGPGSWLTTRPKIAPLQDVMTSDLKKRDVAYFTQELGSRDVLHNGKTPIKRADGSDFFESDGLDGVRAQLQRLRDPVGRQFLDKCGDAYVDDVRQLARSPKGSFPANKEFKERIEQELQSRVAATTGSSA
jgi:hypothetical protein